VRPSDIYTSAVTGSLSRTSASPGRPDGIRRRRFPDVALTDLQSRCDLLRSLHRPGDPLVLPNAWDVATAKAVVAAGYAVVATTSWGVAASLGYEDGERAPADAMFGAAARMATSVEVPVTIDAEGGYGMEPAELVGALRDAGAAGCNLEDTEWPSTSLRDPDRHAEWLRAVREAALREGYPLVINARVDSFFHPFLADEAGPQEGYLTDAVRRANAYLEVGIDCVYPICLWEANTLSRFMSEVSGPVNIAMEPHAPSISELAALGVARVSWGPLLQWDAIARFKEQLTSLRD
jgi:2-methylisocitrate lyase-like PEP mutase family enzyme